MVSQDQSVEVEAVQKLKDDARILSALLANVQFSYRDLVKNYDRTKVKGVVAKLIKVKDLSTMTALEVSSYKLTNPFLLPGFVELLFLTSLHKALHCHIQELTSDPF